LPPSATVEERQVTGAVPKVSALRNRPDRPPRIHQLAKQSHART
jgi:hypothetical protein